MHQSTIHLGVWPLIALALTRCSPVSSLRWNIHTIVADVERLCALADTLASVPRRVHIAHGSVRADVLHYVRLHSLWLCHDKTTGRCIVCSSSDIHAYADALTLSTHVPTATARLVLSNYANYAVHLYYTSAFVLLAIQQHSPNCDAFMSFW